MWMADYSADIQPTGTDIPTAEIAGETYKDAPVVLYPAKNQAPELWTPGRFGDRYHALTMGKESCFASWSMFPGWQKYSPLYRIGKILSIDGDLAKVQLYTPLISSEQNLPIPPSDPGAVDVFERQTHEKVPFRYLDCGAAAFTVGDEVVIEYTGQHSVTPVIIGFADHPQ